MRNEVAPMSKFTRITPRFPVADLRRTMEFYTQILNFREDVLWPEDKPTFCILTCNHISLGFFIPDEHRPAKVSGNGEFYIEVENVRELHEEIKGRVAVEWGPEVYFDGRREFAIRDP